MADPSDRTFMASLQQLVVSLLAQHAYSICDLAQECAQQLHAPMCEIMTPLADSLCEMMDGGRVHYDRQQHLVILG
ncbi:MAG: hypothetical protein ACHWZW_00325 [Spirulina sp.]